MSLRNRDLSLLIFCTIFFSFITVYLTGCKIRKKNKPITPTPIEGNIPSADISLLNYHPLEYGGSPEMRAVWITTIYALDWPKYRGTSQQIMQRQREELKNILNQLKSNNINTVFFQVRLRGDLLYPSKIEPQSSILTNNNTIKPDYDPLVYAVEEAHKRGIALHAWIVTYPLGNKSHIDQLGYGAIAKRRPYWTIFHRGEYYLDPGNPEVRTFIAQIAADIARRYDVDGIHFDYIRYPEGAETFNDRDSFQKYAPRGMSKALWRERNISNQLKEVADSVRRIDNGILISAAPIGRYRDIPGKRRIGWNCVESVAQNPKVWFREGSVDFIAPMMYYKDDFFDPYLSDWKTQMQGGTVIPGLGVYRTQDKSNWNAKDIERQILLIRQTGLKGVAFYRQENILPSNKGIYDVIKNEFAMPVRALPFPNRALSIPGIPIFTSCYIKGTDLYLRWSMPNGRAVHKYNIFFNIYDRHGNPGEDYLFQASVKGEFLKIPLSIFPKKGKIHFRVEGSNKANVTGWASKPLVIDLKKYSFE